MIGSEDLAGDVAFPVPQVLVDDAELVAGTQVGADVDIPAEDVDHLGGDLRREPGIHRVLLEAALDPARETLDLDEVWQGLAAPDHRAVGPALERQQRVVVDIVEQRLEPVGRAIEMQHE
jgi:hypothetical protein